MKKNKTRTQSIFGTGRALAAAVLAFCLAFTSELSVTYADSMIPIGNPDAKKPEITAQAAVLYSQDLDKIIFSRNPGKKYYPYSITKLMTAYLAAENLSLDTEVRVSAAAADDIADGSTIYLEEGECITVEDLMYGALLVSGNDAAAALAEAVSGSEAKFAELMNKTAKDWGCTKTHFANASGVLDSDHYTTAEDLLIIVRNTLANETVRKIASTNKYTIPKTNKSKARKLTNLVLKGYGKIKGVQCGKTGTWSYEDASLALLYSKDDLTAIAIMLKDTMPGREDDARKLLEYASASVPGFIVNEEGDILDSVWIRHGARTRVSTTIGSNVYAYPADGRESSITTKIVSDKTSAPLSRGDKVGTYEVYCGGKLVATRELLAAADVKKGWLPSYAYISNRMTLLIIGLILILGTLLILIRRQNLRRKRARMEARKQQRIHEIAEAQHRATVSTLSGIQARAMHAIQDTQTVFGETLNNIDPPLSATQNYDDLNITQYLEMPTDERSGE